MLPVQSLRLQVGNLLAADTTTLAPVAANKVALVVNNFVPDENLTLSSFTLASFTGSSPIAAGASPMDVGVDPSTSDQVITIKAPAGGWVWNCTATPSPAQTVYGFILTDSTGANLLGMQLLPQPTTISAAGQFIDLGKIDMTIVQQPIS